MTDGIPRRDFLKTTSAAAFAIGADALHPDVRRLVTPSSQAVPILPLTSTSEVFVPPRGRGFMKFSFDNPEPSVAFAGLRFAFLVFTYENAYSLDAARMSAAADDDALLLDCTGFVWAGGQQRAPGRLTAHFRMNGNQIVWDADVELDQPIKAVTTVIRGVPRGRISTGGGQPFDPRNNELLFGYPFGGGDLFGSNTAGGLSTPFMTVEAGEGDYFSIASLDDQVRTKRFYLQPGESGYRVEAVFEAEGWNKQNRRHIPAWRAWRSDSLEAAADVHFAHLERAYDIPRWETRADVPAWLRDTALVVTLHGMHYTGFMFNDYGRQLEILQWIATQIPAGRVLAFLSAWDGRYYWDYPNYRASDRMGGEAGFRRLVQDAQQLGFRVMPMFGANAANRRQASFERMADAASRDIDGEVFNLDWVDWDNDRHQEGWLAYMNLGVESWRRWLTDRIADTIERYGVDAYFLDIVAGWINTSRGDMHAGTRQLVLELRKRYPNVLACGEFQYDALLGFIPLYHVGLGRARAYARNFSHLSHPAPGRGSSGVHESGFGRFNDETLSLSDNTIPTLQVVDDTLIKHRDVMAALIARAKERAGL